MTGHDQLQRFLFEDSNLRGSIVHLKETYRQATDNRDYPPGIRHLLGECLAACALMGDSLKFEGNLSLQAQGKGPLQLLVSDCSNRLRLRGVAQYEAQAPLAGNLPALIGDGRLVITISPEDGQRYQGIVPLEKPSLAKCLQDYFRLSEQLRTFMLLFADDNDAAGLMLQQLPTQPASPDLDLWPRAVKLAETLTARELFQLPAEAIVHRLYHQERTQLFPARMATFGCGCSRLRTRAALEALGRDECIALLNEREVITIDCNFCGRRYIYDRGDVEALFGGPRLH